MFNWVSFTAAFHGSAKVYGERSSTDSRAWDDHPMRANR